MPVPSLITDLSTTPASNSPAGSENVFPSLDDYLRAQSAFLASVRDNSGNGWVSPYLPLAGGTMTGTVAGLQMASANGGQLAGLRNKIINGNMGIFQRGTTAVTTNATYGPADRWVSGFDGGSISTTQGTFVSGDTLFDTGGAQYFTQIAVTSPGTGASKYCLFAQNIEDVRSLAGQTVTVSFWAKAASGTPLIGVAIDQFFGTGGSAAVAGVGQAQALTTTWTKYSKTFTVPSINSKTVGTSSYNACVFWLDAGSDFNTRSGTIGQVSKTVSIAQVQLEVGPVATPFEQRPIGMELALCQRYYIQFQASNFFGNGQLRTGGLTSYAFISTPVQMRIAPAATPNTGSVYVGDTQTAYTSLGINSAQPNGIYCAPTFATSAGTVKDFFMIVNGVSAVGLSAEL